MSVQGWRTGAACRRRDASPCLTLSLGLLACWSAATWLRPCSWSEQLSKPMWTIGICVVDSLKPRTHERVFYSQRVKYSHESNPCHVNVGLPQWLIRAKPGHPGVWNTPRSAGAREPSPGNILKINHLNLHFYLFLTIEICHEHSLFL